ncbi:MAG TPA: energy transducer TonB [bacterium]|mgnify:CR=1 FL=1|nr:energy transducer TonB [bacterium]HOL48415.1 energy transducer TonB [bacterium]HPQ19462.1 energy transducer TonB [bacterium]
MKNKLFFKSLIISLFLNLLLFFLIPYITYFSSKIKYPDEFISSLTIDIKKIEEEKYIISKKIINDNKEHFNAQSNVKNEILNKTINNKFSLTEHKSLNINFDNLNIIQPDINIPLYSENFRFENSSQGISAFTQTGIFNESELENKPQIIYKIEPTYPIVAKKLGIEGYVVLQFIVNENGNVENIIILENSPSDIFNENTIIAVKQWKFIPGSFNNQKVKTNCQIKINFKLNK